MYNAKILIDRLAADHTLAADEYLYLVGNTDAQTLAYINNVAAEVCASVFHKSIYIRGLIEIGNVCRNDCLYCGIRRSNSRVGRYRLNRDDILAACGEGYALGLRTFVLQGGEEGGKASDDFITGVVREVKELYPDAAVTLSLGEKDTDTYRRFREAGADRYLLRHETFNAAHYSSLHPASMSRDNRLRCLADLKRLGFQTGTGIMVGSPGQTAAHIVEDILFIGRLRPEMIGIGPFIPHRDTPFGTCRAGSLEQTLLLLSVFRLMFPHALIPSTTALATLSPGGREAGILAGANVVMPNLSPASVRRKYNLYNGKACTGSESVEGLKSLEESFRAIGYKIDFGRGDYAG